MGDNAIPEFPALPGLRDRLLLSLAMFYPFSLLFKFHNKGVKE
jgi:hypothetical protein